MSTLNIGPPHINKYLSGYATFHGGAKNNKEYNTRDEALAAGDAMIRGGGHCHGIQFERRGIPRNKSRKYTLRIGQDLKTPGENSMWKGQIAYLII
jgi:hypothetical protein